MLKINDQDNLKTTQLVEDFHPKLRRRAYTSIRTSFPSYFPTTQLQQQQQSSLPSMHQSQIIIFQNFNKINHIIDVVDQHIRRRIQCYENEVVNVVQKQIQQMRQQTQKVVIQFNSMILEKNKQQQIWSLNNQLDYFKSEAKKLYESNKQLKKQYLQIKKRIKQYQWQLQNREVIMQKLLYKYQKEKNSKNRLKLKMDLGKQMIQQSSKKKSCIKNFKNNSISHIDKNNIYSNSIRVDELINKQIKQSTNSNNKLFTEVAGQSESKGFYKNNSESKIILFESQLNSNNKKQNNNNNNENDNSILKIQYDQNHSDNYISQNQSNQSQQSKIQFIRKNQNNNSINLTINNNNIKPKQIDQQSQVNIYLSEHSYKTLFQIKHTTNNNNKKFLNNNNVINNNTKIIINKQTKQISTQTDLTTIKINTDKNYQNYHLQNYQHQRTKQYTTSPKIKSINFIKNGFTIRQASIQKNHLRSNSYHMNSSTIKRQTDKNQSNCRKQRINTQTNFNKSQQLQFQFQLFTPKHQKFIKNNNNHNKLFNNKKMVNKFQRNKIAERAYDKNNPVNQQGKKLK